MICRVVMIIEGSEEKAGHYLSEQIPRIGEIVDTNVGAYRVSDVWHDVAGRLDNGEARQSCVRILVNKCGK